MDRSRYSTSTSAGNYTETTVRTPDYKRKLMTGQHLPINAYLFRRYDVKSPANGSGQTEINVAGLNLFVDAIDSGGFQHMAGGRYVVVPSITGEVQRCTNRLMQKVRNVDIDLGVALGEYRETAKFLTNAAVSVARSYRALRKGDLDQAMQTLKKARKPPKKDEYQNALSAMTGRRNESWRDIPGVASNAWLAYSYGLRPLVKDCYDAVELLQKGYQSSPPVTEVRTKVNTIVRGVSVGVVNPSYVCSIYGYISTAGAIRFGVSNPLMRTLDQVGLVNPASVAWELVPFSFVVDWFVPIGNFITGIVPPQGVQFVDGWVSTKARGTCHREFQIWKTKYDTIELYKKRSALSGFPRYHLIVPDISLSKSQITSGLALLFQASAWGKQKMKIPPERVSKRDPWTSQWPEFPWYAR